MKKLTESLEEFFENKFGQHNHFSQNELGQFNVFNIEDLLSKHQKSSPYNRRDFYKIMLYQGDNIFHYGDKSIPISGNTLLFFDPKIPYTSDPLLENTKGYFCVFTLDFFQMNMRLNINELPIFSNLNYPLFPLDKNQFSIVHELFQKIETEFNSDYLFKYELIKNYVSELLYQATKWTPSMQSVKEREASSRILSVFLELLERQFPIEGSMQRFELRSPSEVAKRLALHVNYLNRAIKKSTGKTTSDLINNRLITEAKALLLHTDWNISEIAYCLGFENQPQFNHFFKRYAKVTPSKFRKV